jgi:hypothetical protein
MMLSLLSSARIGSPDFIFGIYRLLIILRSTYLMPIVNSGDLEIVHPRCEH